MIRVVEMKQIKSLFFSFISRRRFGSLGLAVVLDFLEIQGFN
jgi:hypothetical protein